MMRLIPEMINVDEPNQRADNRDNFRKHVAKVIQFAFERGLLGDLGRDGMVNISNSSTRTNCDDNCQSITTDNGGTLRG